MQEKNVILAADDFSGFAIGEFPHDPDHTAMGEYQYVVEDGEVILPFAALDGVGESAAKSIVNEYDVRPFATVEDLSSRARINKAALESLRKVGVLDGLAETDQFSFF